MYNPIKTDLIDIVVYFASFLRPDTYLELGLYKAKTILRVKKHVKQAIGVDIRKPDITDGYVFYQMDTDTFFSKIRDEEICIPVLDMVFIDACHSYKQSLKDFNNVFRHVSDDGLIFLHDTYPKSEAFTDPSNCEDSYKTAWDIRMTQILNCEIMTVPCHPGLSIVRKSKKQLLWKK